MLGVKCRLYTEADQQERIQNQLLYFYSYFLYCLSGMFHFKIFCSAGKEIIPTHSETRLLGLRNSEDVEVNEDDCKCSHEQHEDAVFVCFVSPYL